MDGRSSHLLVPTMARTGARPNLGAGNSIEVSCVMGQEPNDLSLRGSNGKLELSIKVGTLRWDVYAGVLPGAYLQFSFSEMIYFRW